MLTRRGGRGHVLSLAGCNGNLRCGLRFLPANSEVKTKRKKFSARNLRLHLSVHVCFSCWVETISSRLWRHKYYQGGTQTPKRSSVTPGLFLSVEVQSSLGGLISRLGGTSSDLEGHGLEMPHTWRRACWNLSLE